MGSRKHGQVFSAQEVAALLRVPLARIVTHCRAAGALGAASFFWGCWEEAEGWMIPYRALRRIAHGLAGQLYTVAEVAALLGFSEGTIRRRLVLVKRGADVDRVRLPWQIAAIDPLSTNDVRIPAAEVDRIISAGLAPAPKEEAAA